MKLSLSLVVRLGVHMVLASFSVRAADPLSNWSHRVTGRGLYDVAFGNGVFVTASGNGILKSHDGVGWSLAYPWERCRGIIYDNENDRFIGVGYALFTMGAVGSVGVSSDGEAWTVSFVWSVLGDGLMGAAYGNETLVAVYWGASLISTTDLENWTWDVASPVYNVAFGNGHFVAVGRDGLIQTSTNGVDWVVVNSGVTNSLADITYANEQFVAVGDRGTILRSSDSITWNPSTSPATNDWRSVAFGAGMFVAVGKPVSSLISSADGESWQLHGTDLPLPPTEDSMFFRALTYGNGTFAGIIQTLHRQQSYYTFDLYQSASVLVELMGSIDSDLNSIQLTGYGGMEQPYLLQESTNLTDWTDLLMFTNSAPRNILLNAPLSTAPQRFFRSATLPGYTHGVESQPAGSNQSRHATPDEHLRFNHEP